MFFCLFFNGQAVKKVMPFLIPVNTEVVCAHAHPSTLHTALFFLVVTRTKQLANLQTSYYEVVGTDKLLHTKKRRKKLTQNKEKRRSKPTENRSVLNKVSSVFYIFVRFFGLQPNRRHH